MSGDCCEKLKEQLAALNTEVGRVRQEFQKANQRIGELDRRLKNLEGKNTPNKQGGEKNNNESEILRRLAKSEKDILILGGISKEIIDDIKNILDSIDEHNQNAGESQNVLSNIMNFFINE